MTTFFEKVVRRIWYLIATLIILAAVSVSVSRLLSPVLDHHRAEFEKWASVLLKSPITIDGVRLSWNVYAPALALEHVVFLDPTTRKPRFEIQQLKIRVNIFHSLFTWQLVTDDIKISGADLTLRQQTSGQIHIQGFQQFSISDNFTGASVQGNEAVKWIMDQPRLVLADVRVHYFPASGSPLFVTLEHVLLTNGNLEHVFQGNVVLNQDVPVKATINLKWIGDLTDLQHVPIHLYLYLEGISLPQWLAKKSMYGLQIQQGLGSAKIWADWDHNQWHKVQSKFEFYELQVKSLVTRKTQVISRLSGNLGWKHDGNKQIFAGDQILFDFPGHLWPVTDFYAEVIPNAEGKSFLKTLRIGYFDLTDTRELAIASGLLLDKFQKPLIAINPIGEMSDLQVTFQQPLNDIAHISLSAQFSGLSFNAWEKFPGVTNLKGNFSWDGKQGSLNVNSRQTSLTVDQVFSDPLPLDQLSGSLYWKKNNNDEWSLEAKNLRAMNADLKAHADMTMTILPQGLPSINLIGDFSIAHAEHVANYLPLKIFEPGLVRWLRNAFSNGRIESGEVVLNGRLSDFPFENKTGTFTISGNVKNLDLRYAPDWPLIRHMNALLTFSGSSMAVAVNSGKILNSPITQIQAKIPTIGSDAPQILSVQGLINTDLADALHFIRVSPLQKTIGKSLVSAELVGPMQLKLGLSLPLGDPDKIKITGNVEILKNAALTFPAWKLTLDQIKGAFQFTEQDMQAKNLSGRLFEQPVTLNISTQHKTGKPTYVLVDLQGNVSIPVLQTQFDIPLTRVLSGTTAYTAKISIPSQVAQAEATKIAVLSDLKGVHIALPAPFGKQAESTKNVELDILANQGQFAQAKLIYADLFNAIIRYQDSDQDEQSMLIDLTSKNVVGQLIVPPDLSQQPIQAKFQRFYLTSLGKMDEQSSFNPKLLPAISFAGEDVRFGDKQLGHVTLNLQPKRSGLTINQLHMETGSLDLNAAGSWLFTDGHDSTQLRGTITTPNVSHALNQWGFSSGNLVGSNGNMAFDLSWPSAPYQPSLGEMSGTLSLKLGEGRIIDLGESTDAKLGIGRMLSLFSLETIPRRLSLDFSDLFQKGYSFDFLKGDFTLENGNATTKNSRFDGPVARVDIFGRIGFVAKDFDLTLSVTPYVASSLPIVATLATLNPLAGIATWAVEKVISNQISQVTTYHYNITGAWDNPVWKQVGSSAR